MGEGLVGRFAHSGASLILLFSIFSMAMMSITASSASSSCDVPPSSDWPSEMVPGDFFDIETLDGGSAALPRTLGENSRLMALDRGLSTEWSDGSWSGFPGIEVGNSSATIITMSLVPGYKYTFCIDFSERGDVYLLADSNLEQYRFDYECRNNDFFDEMIQGLCDFDSVPVEWRDMLVWLPFRDAHAYESVTYEEFSVSIDTSGSSWSLAGMTGGDNYQEFHLILDGWDNGRPNDEGASGDMSVEVLIDVERRVTLPNYTAYLVIGALPLSCIIIPIVFHSKYHSTASEGEDSGEMREVPFLKEG
ncbi:MAG: hypothetical protein CMB03_01940 [Euryarchaeota archaeon]|nr:hypothetical protein [Euryarchaeota archaeon]